MRTRILLTATLLVFLFTQASSCGTPGNPSDPLGDFPTLTPAPPATASEQLPAQVTDQTGEARIRYIMADIQLSGLDGYYRGFPDDPEAAEAISRWDQGIRVVNIDQFGRKLVNDTWMIVYTGTDQVINGMDVILSQADTSSSSTYLCGNPYFPDRVGTRWVYEFTRYGTTETLVVEVTTLTTAASRVSMSDNGDLASGVLDFVPNQWTCNPDGSDSAPEMGFPPLANLTPGFSWTTAIYGNTWTVIGFPQVQTPSGTYEAIEFCYQSINNTEYCRYYAQDIGLIKVTYVHPGADNGFELVLIDFNK